MEQLQTQIQQLEQVMTPQGIERLKQDEGYRKFVYQDMVNIPTIGYGYNLEANILHLNATDIAKFNRAGLQEAEASELLERVVGLISSRLKHELPFWSKLSLERRDVLVNMAYNLGVDGLLKFETTLRILSVGNYSAAAEQMLKSKWAKQVPNRAARLAKILSTGSYS